jgi:hypothetical protein
MIHLSDLGFFSGLLQDALQLIPLRPILFQYVFIMLLTTISHYV